jgi:hypothetical protein
MSGRRWIRGQLLLNVSYFHKTRAEMIVVTKPLAFYETQLITAIKIW